MDNEDEDDGVGLHLKRIRAAQAAAMASDDEEEEEDDELGTRWKQAKLFHASESSQGFSQDLPSQEQQQQKQGRLYYQQPSPDLMPIQHIPHYRPMKTVAEVQAATIAFHNEKPLFRPPVGELDYRDDPTCPFAPGEFRMAGLK
jgi:hypothetical protein